MVENNNKQKRKKNKKKDANYQVFKVRIPRILRIFMADDA